MEIFNIFGLVGMGFGVFGLMAFFQLQVVAKELNEIKSELKKSGVLTENN